MHNSQGHYISTIYRHLQIYLNNQFSVFGFGSGQYLFFNLIAHYEGISQKELSRRLAIDKATTAKAVHKLTELGYIIRQQDSNDKRYNNLFLTEKGKKILPEVHTILKGTRSLFQQNMTPEDSEHSLRLLDMMLNNILAEVRNIRNEDDK